MQEILLIDDEPDFCYMTKLNLEAVYDCKVITAIGGKEGIKKAFWYKPDLVLLDITMPDMDGLEVLKKLKGNAKTKDIPVLIFTAQNVDEFKIRAAGLFVEDYILKPIELNLLKSKIENVIKRKQQENTAGDNNTA